MNFIKSGSSKSQRAYGMEMFGKILLRSRTKIEIDTYVIYADQGIGMILKRPNKKFIKFTKLIILIKT